MSSIYRFYVKDKRISTAITTRSGDILQVYPSKKIYASESDWRSFWEKETTTRVEVETVPLPQGPAKPKKQRSKANVDDWVMRPTTRFQAPAGKYYIGDLCYAISDDVYDKIFGLYDYESGLYSYKNGKDFFLVDGTSSGDGCYLGSDDKEFCVDAGIIGICPASLATKDCDGGHFYTFDTSFLCTFRNGRFVFTGGNQSLVIET